MHALSIIATLIAALWGADVASNSTPAAAVPTAALLPWDTAIGLWLLTIALSSLLVASFPSARANASYFAVACTGYATAALTDGMWPFFGAQIAAIALFEMFRRLLDVERNTFAKGALAWLCFCLLLVFLLPEPLRAWFSVPGGAFLAAVLYGFLAASLISAVRAGHKEFAAPALAIIAMPIVLLTDAALALRNLPHSERVNPQTLWAPIVVVGCISAFALRLSKFLIRQGAATAQLRGSGDDHRRLLSLIDQVISDVAVLTTTICDENASRHSDAEDQLKAVEQMQQAMRSLLYTSEPNTTKAVEALSSAERAQEVAQNVCSHVAALATHVSHINQTTLVVRDVANKTDLLSLHAALESIQAGAAGKGFALIARQMQHLAENVMAEAQSIQSLMQDIHAATQATLLSSERATRLSRGTADLAREIVGMIAAQQTNAHRASGRLEALAGVAQQHHATVAHVLTRLQTLTAASEQLRHWLRGHQSMSSK